MGKERTHPFPLWHFKSSYRGFFARRFCPGTDRVEGHFAVPRVGTGFSTPWLVFFERCYALREGHDEYFLLPLYDSLCLSMYRVLKFIVDTLSLRSLAL